MTRAAHRRVAGISVLGALALTLSACGDDTSSIAGAGASSMERAMQGWLAGFQEQNPGVSASYDPVGSGAGRGQFLEGAVGYAGSDAALEEDEIAQASERCFGGEVIELPLYISPIAVAYHLPGIEGLNLTPEAIAGIFSGDITTWNDPAIADANPDAQLPDMQVVPVNRADDSGTTENFTEYLSAVAPDVWTHGAVETWPVDGTQSAQGTSGVVSTAEATEGSITYADGSQIGDTLQDAHVGVGDEFVELSSESAARIVDVSEPSETATDQRLTIDLARDTTESGAYPIVLVSYTIACDTYDDPQDAAGVQGLLTYIASPEGQQRAADPSVAGSAPISDTLREQATAAIDSISAQG